MYRTRFTRCAAVLLGLIVIQTPGSAQVSEADIARVETQVDSEIKRFEKVVADHPCRQAFMIAIADPNVRKLFLTRLANECFVLKDICCLQLPMIPEQAQILFDFDCAPNCFCLLDPQFVVTVDKINNKVVQIIDPYQGPTKPCISIRVPAPINEVEAGVGVDGGCRHCTSDKGCKLHGRAAYAALQDGDTVYVFANGVHRTSGFKNCLEQGPEDIFPPIYDFRITSPSGPVLQVITPFTVCDQFRSQRKLRSITVRDAAGQHSVPVTQL